MAFEVEIQNLNCICVPLHEADFKDFAAIYIIICVKGDNFVVIDIGQSGEVGTRIDAHPRRECWKRKCNGDIYACVYRMPSDKYSKQDRMDLEGRLRAHYGNDNLCGDK